MKLLFTFPNRVKCYQHILKNGLKIYMVPNMKRNNVVAYYTVNFGGDVLEFNMNGRNHRLPTGIAHFLEHQLFNQKDGTDALSTFTNYSANANASTSSSSTTYLFTTMTNFKKNLHNLISFVNEPYFEEKSVNTEKGIILQEAKKYRDIPDYVLMDRVTTNLYHHHPNKELVIGRDQDIKKTSVDDLYTTHKAFYQPSNMAIIIAGRFKIKDAMQVIKNYFHNHKQSHHPVMPKTINEPATVARDYEEIKMDIAMPKVAIVYKIKKTNPQATSHLYLITYLNCLFGATSDFAEHNKKTNLVQYFGYEALDTKSDYFILILWGETKKHKLFIQTISDLIKSQTIDEEAFQRVVKLLKANYLEITDSNQAIVDFLHNYFIFYGQPQDELELINKLSYNKANKFIKATDFSNQSVTIVKR